MENNGTQSFSSSPQAVWDALHNGALLQQCIPGAEEVSWQGDSAVSARVSVGIGPFRGAGTVQAQVAEQQAPSHLKLVFNRQGAHNSAQGALTVDLAPEGAGTRVTYGASATLGGPIAVLDNPLSRPLVDHAIGEFFSNLKKHVG